MPSAIDLHTHSRMGSSDSMIPPDDLVEQAKAVGLTGVCITEHGHERLPMDFITDLGQRHDFLVISGIEASTDIGHILIYGVHSYPRRLIRAKDISEYVLSQGGILVVAHPFRYDLSPKPWLPKPKDPLTLDEAIHREVFNYVTAMETANGWANDEDTEFCELVSKTMNLPGTGGSDAHATNEVGICTTIFQADIRDEQDFMEALRSGKHYGEDRRERKLRGPVHTYFFDSAP